MVDAPICLGNWCPHNYSGGYAGSMTVTLLNTLALLTGNVGRAGAVFSNGYWPAWGWLADWCYSA